MAQKRLFKEMEEMINDPPPKCRAGPIADDIFAWEGTLEGPPDTPYEEGVFRIKILFPQDYPFKPPIIQFLTKVYHPNISLDGYICLDTLGSQWSAVLTINKVLLSILSLLADPNPDDSLDYAIANEFIWNREMYIKKAKEWTKKYAKPPEPPEPKNIKKSKKSLRKKKVPKVSTNLTSNRKGKKKSK